MDFIFEQLRTGGDRNFGYLIADRKAGIAALVDPSYSPEALVERAEAQGLKVEWILNTHGHGDHINGNEQAQKLTGASIAAFEGASQSHERSLRDGDVLEVGSLSLNILHVPGHTEDHIVIYEPKHGVLMTGDFLFVGKVGGTYGEDHARQEWKSFQRVMAEIPGPTTVWPGHDYGCRPSSTIALEKAVNPFLLASSFDEFYELKNTWTQFKATHGLI